MERPNGIESREDVCEVEWIGPDPDLDPGDARPALLVEVPHGATRRTDFERVRARLSGDLPEDLIDFFFANTDVGSTEYGRKVAEYFVRPEALPLDDASSRPGSHWAKILRGGALVVRCLIPRTFIDTNRIVDARSGAESGELTAAVNDYVRSPADLETLGALHRTYHEVVERAYAWICGGGGLALMPHTYAPKSIFLPDEDFDEGIGKALRKAYAPERYEAWKSRPEVDVISEDLQTRTLAPVSIVAALRDRLHALGFEMAENASYRLHPSSMGHRYSAAYPGRVLCLEVRRDLLGDPFQPFEETPISPEKVAHVAAPIAGALHTGWPDEHVRERGR